MILKAIVYKVKNTLVGMQIYIILASKRAMAKVKGKLCETSANWLDESFKYILAVVIGLAFLAGLYSITKDTILPTLTEKIKEGFSFKG